VVLANVNPTSVTESIPLKVFDLFLGAGERDWSADMLAGMTKVLAKGKERREEMIASRATETQPSLELDKYVGAYEHNAYGKAIVALENGKLTLQIGKIKGTLNHWHYDTFQLGSPSSLSPGLQASFILNARGKVDELRIPGVADFKRVSEKNE